MLTWAGVSVEPDGSGRLVLRKPTKPDPDGRSRTRPISSVPRRLLLSACGRPIRPPTCRFPGSANAGFPNGYALLPVRRGSLTSTPCTADRRVEAHSLAERGARHVEPQQASGWK